MDFDELEKYRTGKSEDGHDQFSVPIKPDEDGLLGRECSNEDCETKYFKISLFDFFIFFRIYIFVNFHIKLFRC